MCQACDSGLFDDDDFDEFEFAALVDDNHPIVIHGDDSESDDEIVETTLPKSLDFGQDEFGPENFIVKTSAAALLAIEEKALQTKLLEANSGQQLPTISMSAADFQNALQEAFILGRTSYNAAWRRKNVFRFLDLPAEMRVLIYEHALQDTNDKTKDEKCTLALPIPTSKSKFGNWSNVTMRHKRPTFNTALLRTCKQIYYETREDFLYKERHFKASIKRLDKGFLDFAPNLRFWSHIRHFSLVLENPELFKTIDLACGIETIVTLLDGGKNLQSFKLDFDCVSFLDHDRIFLLKGLKVPTQASISITQHFFDWTEVRAKEVERAREAKLHDLMAHMRGADGLKAPGVEVMTSRSQNNTRHIRGWDTMITLESDRRKDVSSAKT
ncbi:hypothetical protein EJ08DRAFT_657196 [Tothia fuscella]|uniref:Uncharacterized protein n=1 Tax=Tothia fuscella TaxID=1048955 RepID=A0A9P4NZ68_9PEZI|nr:hypothetical protein EJ08DRAFT_657196 [Tothia fuscella]